MLRKYRKIFYLFLLLSIICGPVFGSDTLYTYVASDGTLYNIWETRVTPVDLTPIGVSTPVVMQFITIDVYYATADSKKYIILVGDWKRPERIILQ